MRGRRYGVASFEVCALALLRTKLMLAALLPEILKQNSAGRLSFPLVVSHYSEDLQHLLQTVNARSDLWRGKGAAVATAIGENQHLRRRTAQETLGFYAGTANPTRQLLFFSD